MFSCIHKIGPRKKFADASDHLSQEMFLSLSLMKEINHNDQVLVLPKVTNFD
jgi:hypothetical protein